MAQYHGDNVEVEFIWRAELALAGMTIEITVLLRRLQALVPDELVVSGKAGEGQALDSGSCTRSVRCS